MPEARPEAWGCRTLYSVRERRDADTEYFNACVSAHCSIALRLHLCTGIGWLTKLVGTPEKNSQLMYMNVLPETTVIGMGRTYLYAHK